MQKASPLYAPALSNRPRLSIVPPVRMRNACRQHRSGWAANTLAARAPELDEQPVSRLRGGGRGLQHAEHDGGGLGTLRACGGRVFFSD
ncbi:hypothetical protein ISF_01056 [Cordyceps fumosorosea ARSEF 2679]|uniref:Uncharacterized protein n=1 Tax=Cordyceps fumosorosea (strain ARSEF 2679) TaxID=1081104 RepID=A0A168ESE0_CORFA|nr:hypothetical protein ISF_01056 [Cordyceps fumosorosea ARSEF 2679]OAA74155.1 hypothetical protein ISF_01056 [Cordyceps fumosorosea ARSEF 2679]